ncbi:hypothetical protein [Sphingomonas beigongshangi]|uniref:hypothetical protein n=1 Tax=Sphingomonas beigongshangi TaxID=2782540 RepID=UPI001AEF28EB|nr:hypothetical protein [Sphingomonas beigongshangi]
MADRVSASIIIGGALDAPAYAQLAELIAAEGLAIEWDGDPFESEHRVDGEPLRLFAHEVAGGHFEEIEDWCVSHRIPFVRWCGGYSGQWGPERVVATGDGTAVSYAVSEDDEVVISRSTIETLGSLDAVLAHFDAAEFIVPPLVVTNAADVLSSFDGAHHVQ